MRSCNAGNDLFSNFWLAVIATYVLVHTGVVLISGYECALIRTISHSLVSPRSNGHRDGSNDRFQQAGAANSSNNRCLAGKHGKSRSCR